MKRGRPNETISPLRADFQPCHPEEIAAAIDEGTPHRLFRRHRGKVFRRKLSRITANACLLLICAITALAQGTQPSQNTPSNAPTPTADQTPKPERGYIEFGARGLWGDERSEEHTS